MTAKHVNKGKSKHWIHKQKEDLKVVDSVAASKQLGSYSEGHLTHYADRCI